MQATIKRVEQALTALRSGQMVILTDHPDRENEGDLICAADTITTEGMNWMIRNSSGIVCISMPAEQLKTLQLPLMVAAEANSSTRGTPFTLSIDAKMGITTGVSAADRVTTIKAAINPNVIPDDLVKPGHVFPLQAHPHGVLGRQGHTEGALDLTILAGLTPAAVLCEIMNPDGTMTQGRQLTAFAQQHQLQILSIDDIIAYRLIKEDMIEDVTQANLPLKDYGDFKIQVFKERFSDKSHFALVKSNTDFTKPVLIRIHSCCTTGDLFSSLRCDCHQQLHYSLQRISEEGGILIYLNQEGRGIGLFNKIKAYALQEQGIDTVEANIALGLPIDARQYYMAGQIIRHNQAQFLHVLTNNPTKINELNYFNFQSVKREPMPVDLNQYNENYITTKIHKLMHEIKPKYAN